MKMEAEPASET